MSVHYHPGKANVLEDACSRPYMGSVVHVEKERNELVKHVNRIACLGVSLISITNCGRCDSLKWVKIFIGTRGQENQDSDLILLHLKGVVH